MRYITLLAIVLFMLSIVPMSTIAQEDLVVDLELVFANCPYSFENVSEITGFISYITFKYSRLAVPVEEAIDFINLWEGTDVWIGYGNQTPEGQPREVDVPSDIQIVAILHMTLVENLVDGRLLENDPTRIDFFLSESTGMVYVFPYRSLVPFARENGKNFGAHLCGIFEVDLSLYVELESIFGTQDEMALGMVA